MFLWRSRCGSGSVDGLGNLSKAEILRGVVTEKLTTAAQEIFAVVERTVAGYEEEASGFRRELDRQRKQLELLQPRVKLERTALMREEESCEVLNDKEEQQQQQQQQQCPEQTDEEDTGSLGLQWFDDDAEEDEEQLLSVPPASFSKQRREDLNDPDFQLTPRSQSARRRPGRPRVINTEDHLDLRICILEDVQTDVLSNSVFQKCPIQQLQCPRGLQEDDFLLLLRSTFPQLSGQRSFDVFLADRTRRLQPLRVKSLTPEEIWTNLRWKGAGGRAMYIRLKQDDEDPQSSSGDLRPPQTPDESPSNSATTSADQAIPFATEEADVLLHRFPSPKKTCETRKRGRPRRGEEQTHHLRVCFLDVQSSVITRSDLQKSSIQDLRVPRGLKEAEFMDLLRSTFSQLAGDDKPFHLFKSFRSSKLQRLHLKTRTPEEITKTIRPTGTGKPLLYIRLKTGDDEDQDELFILPTINEETDSSSAAMSNEGRLSSGRPRQRVDVLSTSSASPQQVTDTESHSSDNDPLDDDDDDWKPDPELPRPSRVRRRPSGVEAKPKKRSQTSCQVCGIQYKLLGGLFKHAWSHVDEPLCVCGVCGEQFGSVEDIKQHLRNDHKTHDCSHCSKSFLSTATLNMHMTLHTGKSPFKCDICNKSFTRISSLGVHRWIHVAEKPHKCDICPKVFSLKTQLKVHRKLHLGGDRFHCTICGKSLVDRRSLARHRATHSAERRYGCQVCGKRFKLPSTLKSHEKTHVVRERPYLCDVCCQTFMTSGSLKLHLKTHSSERPFTCTVCSKGFISNGGLQCHMRTHTGEAPYSCSECGRAFKRKSHLNNHVRSHQGIKRFVCTVCGKACSRQEHLKVHMRTHNGERPYQCSVCNKAFTQSHCLKTHMKSHQSKNEALLNASSSA